MSRSDSGLCEKHDIDPVWDECPCCRVEELEVMLEEERSELSLAHGLISAEMARAEGMKPSPGALPDEPRAAYLRGMRHALVLIEGLQAAKDAFSKSHPIAARDGKSGERL